MIITLTYSSSLKISHLLDEKGRLMQNEDGIDVLFNRTNNPLERFNRKLNDRIPQHPMVQVFVQIVRDMHLL
jgi:tRNA(Phe) wybutosine-synthesizing methylase Tyw3